MIALNRTILVLLATIMAISNCLFSLTSENPHGFSTWPVLVKLNAKPRNF